MEALAPDAPTAAVAALAEDASGDWPPDPD
jgi:hypothetical protein